MNVSVFVLPNASGQINLKITWFYYETDLLDQSIQKCLI